jgi:hypothetical protein
MQRALSLLAGLAVTGVAFIPMAFSDDPPPPAHVDAKQGECARQIMVDYVEDNPGGASTPEEAVAAAGVEWLSGKNQGMTRRDVNAEHVVFEKKDAKGQITHALDVVKIKGQWVVGTSVEKGACNPNPPRAPGFPGQ